MPEQSTSRDRDATPVVYRTCGNVQRRLEVWVFVAQVGILGSSCASPTRPKVALRSELITAATRASPKDAKALQSEQQKAQSESEQRPRLSLPPAEASLSATRAVIVPFLPKQEHPSYIAAILGNEDRVWLLSIKPVAKSCPVTSLYESDGRRIRLASRAICPPDRSHYSPCFDFDTINLKGNTLELLGESSGACTADSVSAVRKGDGSWRCERGPTQGFGIMRFWSSGELTAAWYSMSGESFDFGGILRGHLAPRYMPVAIAKGGVHAWALVEESGTHLVEWTGIHWRERADALPVGVSADDIDAMTIDDEGTYYMTTGFCLLVFDGIRFVAHSVPQGFSAKHLVATKAHGLWALGSGRAWHYQPPDWTYVELPMAEVNSEWLAPNGTLWIAGSRAAAGDGLVSSKSEPEDAVVVTLALSGMNEGRSL